MLISTHPPLQPPSHEFLHVPVLDDIRWVAQNGTVALHGGGGECDAMVVGVGEGGAVGFVGAGDVEAAGVAVEAAGGAVGDTEAFGSMIAGAVEAAGGAVGGAVGFVGAGGGRGEFEGGDGGGVDGGVLGVGGVEVVGVGGGAVGAGVLGGDAVDLAITGADTVDFGVVDGSTVATDSFLTRTINLTIIDVGNLDAGAGAHPIAQLEVIKQLHGRILLLVPIRRAVPQELHPVAIRHRLELETGVTHFLEQMVPLEQVRVAHVVDHGRIHAVDNARLWGRLHRPANFQHRGR